MKISSKLTAGVLSAFMAFGALAAVPMTAGAATGDSDGLTVKTTSNFFDSSTAKYGSDTEQIQVTYVIDSNMNAENFQATMSYDPDVLSVADGYNVIFIGDNDSHDVCYAFPDSNKHGVTYNPQNSGYIYFNAADIWYGYDFTDGEVFVTVVFDVVDPDAGETTVDLQMEVLTCAEYKNGEAIDDSEVKLVSSSVVDTEACSGIINSATSYSTSDVTPIDIATPDEPTPAEPAEQTFTDKGSNITVVAQADAELVVSEVTDTKSIDEMNSKLPSGENVLQMFNIALVKDGETVQPTGKAEVRIPCNDKNAKIYRVESDGTLTDMNAVYQDGYLVFYTEHFSNYIVAVPETYTLGDVNEDGVVDISDATAIQKAVAKITELTDKQKLAANVNGDTVVDITDATMIQKYVAKIITEFATAK